MPRAARARRSPLSPLGACVAGALVLAAAAAAGSGAGCSGGASRHDPMPPRLDAGPLDAAPLDAAPLDAAPPPPPPCGSGSAAALGSCVEPARLEQDVRRVAVPRVPGSEGWQAAQDLCAERLAASGFDVERYAYGSGVDVLGELRGVAEPATSVVLGAHYDHIAGCSGADDDASGVAAVLEAARVLGTTRFARTLVVACWDEEETGLRGSTAHATRAAARGDAIAVVFALDPVGYATSVPHTQTMPAGFQLVFPELYRRLEERELRGDWIGAVADDTAHAPAAAFAAHADARGLPNGVLELSAGELRSSLFDDLRRSDHAAFWERGYPAVQLGDTGDFRNPNYHCLRGADEPDTLDYAFLAQVTRATVGAIAETLVPSATP